MITFALFFLFTLVIIILMRSSPAGFEETDRILFQRLRSGQAPAATADPGQALLFQKFCKKKCRYRFVCLQKRHAGRDGTCYEFELSSNALW